MEDLQKTDSTESNSAAFDGKLTLKYKDEAPEFDLNDPQQRQQAIDLMQKGYGAEKTWADAKEIRRVVDAWNQSLEAAKNDDGALEVLRAKIEGYIGRPLTRKEQQEFEEGEFTDDSTRKLMSTVKDLQTEIRLLKDDKKREAQSSEAQQMEDQARKVAEKYRTKKGYPQVTAQELIDYGVENGIFNFDAAYQHMNYQKLIDLEVEEKTASRSKKQSQREKAFAEGEGSFAQISPDMQKKFSKMSSSERANAIAEELARKGLSLVTD